MRGKHDALCTAEHLTRITPACAGKTFVPSPTAPVRQDHPRVCGENSRNEFLQIFYIGSPPRVRGKRRTRRAALIQRGITPACAGKTTLVTYSILTREDHPRVCGENELKGFICERDSGSPPRVRGKPNLRIKPAFRLRITPACAGKTLLCSCVSAS